MATSKSNCIICGAPLKYNNAARELKCELCGMNFNALIECENGHYVCDSCHSADPVTAARALCLRYVDSDPWKIALHIMSLPDTNMHGPEHHVIVGFALVSAYCNESGKRNKLPKLLSIIEERACNIPGGTCGYWGACGSALGAGVFMSAILEANPLGGGKLCNQLTARCLNAIADVSDIRCCKRNLGITICETVAFMSENNIADLPEPDIKCEFSSRNNECIGNICPWHVASAAEKSSGGDKL